MFMSVWVRGPDGMICPKFYTDERHNFQHQLKSSFAFSFNFFSSWCARMFITVLPEFVGGGGEGAVPPGCISWFLRLQSYKAESMDTLDKQLSSIFFEANDRQETTN